MLRTGSSANPWRNGHRTALGTKLGGGVINQQQTEAPRPLTATASGSALYTDFRSAGLGDWTVIDANNDGITWTNTTYGARYETSCSWDEDWNYVCSSSDDWLISPEIQITSAGFYWQTDCGSTIETYVLLGTDEESLQAATLVTPQNGVVDLSAYDGQTIRVAYRVYSDGAYKYITIYKAVVSQEVSITRFHHETQSIPYNFGEALAVMAGQTVTLGVDILGTATSYSWTLEGADISSSTDESVEVTFSTAGQYWQNVTVFNAAGSTNLSFRVIVVDCNGVGELPYSWGYGENGYYGYLCWDYGEGDFISSAVYSTSLSQDETYSLTYPTFTVVEPSVLSLAVGNNSPMSLEVSINGNSTQIFTNTSHNNDTTLYIPLTSYIGQEVTIIFTCTGTNEYGTAMMKFTNATIMPVSLDNVAISGPRTKGWFNNGVEYVEYIELQEGTYYAFHLTGTEVFGGDFTMQWLTEGIDDVIANPFGSQEAIAVHLDSGTVTSLGVAVSFGGQTDTLWQPIRGLERSRDVQYGWSYDYGYPLQLPLHAGGALTEGFVMDDPDYPSLYPIDNAASYSITTLPYHVAESGITKIYVNQRAGTCDSIAAYIVTDSGDVRLEGDDEGYYARFSLAAYKGQDVVIKMVPYFPEGDKLVVGGILASNEEDDVLPWVSFEADTIYISPADWNIVIPIQWSAFAPDINVYIDGNQVCTFSDPKPNTELYYHTYDYLMTEGTHTVVAEMQKYGYMGDKYYDTLIVVSSCDYAADIDTVNGYWNYFNDLRPCWSITETGYLSPLFAVPAEVVMLVNTETERTYNDVYNMVTVIHTEDGTDTIRQDPTSCLGCWYAYQTLSLEDYHGQNIRIEYITGDATLRETSIYRAQLGHIGFEWQTDSVAYAGEPLAIRGTVNTALHYTTSIEAIGAVLTGDSIATYDEAGTYAIVHTISTSIGSRSDTTYVEVRDCRNVAIDQYPYNADWASLEPCWHTYGWVLDSSYDYYNGNYNFLRFSDYYDTTRNRLRSPNFALQADRRYFLKVRLTCNQQEVRIYAVTADGERTEVASGEMYNYYSERTYTVDLSSYAGQTISIEVKVANYSCHLYEFVVTESGATPTITGIDGLGSTIMTLENRTLTAQTEEQSADYTYTWYISGVYAVGNEYRQGQTMVASGASIVATWLRDGDYNVGLIVNNNGSADTMVAVAHVSNDGMPCIVADTPYVALFDGGCWEDINTNNGSAYMPETPDSSTAVKLTTGYVLYSPYLDFDGEQHYLNLSGKGAFQIVSVVYNQTNNELYNATAALIEGTDWVDTSILLPADVFYIGFQPAQSNSYIRDLSIGAQRQYPTRVDTVPSQPADTTAIDTVVYNITYVDTVVYNISTVDTVVYNVSTVDTVVYNITTVDSVVYNITTIDSVVYNIVHSDSVVYDTVVITIYDTVEVAIEGVDNATGAKIYHSGDQIVVEGAQGRTVRLYDSVGRLLGTRRDSFDIVRFDVPATGVYVIKIDGAQARKITLVR